MKNENLKTAWSELGDAAANLNFADQPMFSQIVRDIQESISHLIDWNN